MTSADLLCGGQGSPTPRGQGPRRIFSVAVKDRQYAHLNHISTAVNDRQHSCLAYFIFSSPLPFCAKASADLCVSADLGGSMNAVVPDRTYKTTWCSLFVRGHACNHGDGCRHVHYAWEKRPKKKILWCGTLEWSTSTLSYPSRLMMSFR